MVYFISGHRDITPEEFIALYEPIIEDALKDPQAKFVVGDCSGVDKIAQAYLAQQVSKEAVTVYHAYENPRNNMGNFPTCGGFTSQTKKDAAMTEASDADIAWVRPGYEDSGTARNLKRRLKASQR